MIHLDGADASTTITGSELTPKTWTARGNYQIDTAQSKFGGASGLADGTGDWCDTPSSSDFDFGSGDFALDFWVRFNSVGECGFVSNGAASTAMGFHFGYDGASLVFRIPTSEVTKTWSPSSATWYHVEIDRNGSNLYFFVDGTQVGTTGVAINPPNSTNTMKVGTGFRNSGGNFTTQIYLNGWQDEVRITKGVARHTANFTPATSAYSADATTRKLLLLGVG